MSHDLGFFSAKHGATTEEVRAAYLNSCEGNAVDWPSSSSLDKFIELLLAKYPSIDSYSDDEVDNCPWSCEFDKGDGYIIVSMVFSSAPEVGDFIWQLLGDYQLIVFDPQADKAYLNNLELPEKNAVKKWWQLWK